MNIVGGEAVDVSTDSGFRPLYEVEMAEARDACANPQHGLSPSGACAEMWARQQSEREVEEAQAAE